MRLLLLLIPVALAAQSPEQRAIDYLARETPRWSRENRCFSCHNNGDGARALYLASKRGYRVPAEALADTTAWLAAPEKWDSNPGEPGFSDKKLARIQFAAALVDAIEAGATTDRAALLRAAEAVARDQDEDGSWQIDPQSVGSPATYGPALATHMARRTLEAAQSDHFSEGLAKATLWLLRSRPASVPHMAAIVMALPRPEPIAREAVERLLRAQSSDGGWGPYPMSPSEPFDTALALLALAKAGDPERTAKTIERGRAYLVKMQQSSGGWPETTRPPGSQSYAQHASTSAWAALALVMTR
jgi:squalene cyclase